MALHVKVDRQGRIVIPLRERERLGITGGGSLELIFTPEGLILERRRSSRVKKASDGLPVIVMEDTELVSNEDALEAIHRHRDRS